MKHLLICTIARQCRGHLDRWYAQLLQLTAKLCTEGWTYEISCAENDSTDGTAEWLRDMASSRPELIVSTQTFGTQLYGSVWSLDRLRNLAQARQQCLDQAGDLGRFSKIAYVEVDVAYNPTWCAELILARHPHAAGFGEPDIYSGWSLRSDTNPKESTFLYDTCVTRQSANEVAWDFTNEHQWRGVSVVPTDLGGHDTMCLHTVWSTFNCFAVYDATLFKRGLKWGWVNYRLNTGQERIEDGHGGGWLDADAAVVCEAFREHGRHKIFLNTNCLIYHA